MLIFLVIQTVPLESEAKLPVIAAVGRLYPVLIYAWPHTPSLELGYGLLGYNLMDLALYVQEEGSLQKKKMLQAVFFRLKMDPFKH